MTPAPTEAPITAAPLPDDPAGRLLFSVARSFAVGGGLLLAAVCAVSVISIIGRRLFDSPVAGDMELTQTGCAVAVSAFLPYAQMKNAHVVVDFFTQSAPATRRAGLDRAAAALMSAVAALIAWRSVSGGLDMWRAGEVSMILGLPLWPVYAVIAPAFALLSLTAAYAAGRPRRRSPSGAPT